MVLRFLVHLRQAHDFAFAVNERVVNDSQFFGILQLYTLRISLRHNHVQTLRDEVEVVARTIGQHFLPVGIFVVGSIKVALFRG